MKPHPVWIETCLVLLAPRIIYPQKIIFRIDSEGNFGQPLYPGLHLTFYESHLSVFQFALRHRLTKLAFSDLLNLIDNHLPTTNSMVSLYKLKKHFLHLYRDITYTPHFCCSSCHAALSTLESPCPNNCEDEAMEFLSISVAPQLKRRLEGMHVRDIDAITYIIPKLKKKSSYI